MQRSRSSTSLSGDQDGGREVWHGWMRRDIAGVNDDVQFQFRVIVASHFVYTLKCQIT